ncbi:MAG: MFS transporter [Acidobacteria bacterium]|nr:MFS transporter [Acidobacteriota bacterium]
MVFGAREAAWPLLRNDLGLTYEQVGLLLGLPCFLASFIEPLIGLLGDAGRRRVLIVGGGTCMALALLVVGSAHTFPVLLIALLVLAPASGAFVSLSQASLMDSNAFRHEHLMARWTFAGSLGLVVGPLVLAGAMWMGVGWNGLFLALACSAIALTALAARADFGEHNGPAAMNIRSGLRGALQAIRRSEVWRWLLLLVFSDFMLDVLLGFLALYLVDVAHVTPGTAWTAVAVWSGVGLLGDALLIPLLEKVRGLAYLRYSAAVMFLLYPAFLLTPWFGGKLILLALMGFFNSGWYAILQGRLYSTMPGQSGTVVALSSGLGIVAALIPMLLGVMAQHTGLEPMMWVLLLGPTALLIGLRTRESRDP